MKRRNLRAIGSLHVVCKGGRGGRLDRCCGCQGNEMSALSKLEEWCQKSSGIQRD